jgi:dsRNA-specific ribonuclease
MSDQRQTEVIPGIYFANHKSEEFKMHIESILKKGNMKQKYIEFLTSETSMEAYSAAYTSELVDEVNNYQVMEQLGDLSGNKFIVWYIYSRFPQLKCAEGVKVAARLRINYGSKNSFCQIAEGLGCWKFITATKDLRQRKKKPLLEDVFEAFLGTTESLIDAEYRTGVGYACVYKILKSIFDDMDISLKYESLYDGKTRLKELFDIHSDRLGPLVYEEQKDELLTTSFVYRLDGAKYQTRPDGSVNMSKISGQYRKVMIGKGSAALKADAQQAAACDALKNLAKQGFIKHAPAIYARFANCDEKKPTTKEDIVRICGSQSQINELFPTRGKSKYQSKYMSTVLVKCCRQRDYEGVKFCLEMGASPNIVDSDGMSATDVALIGPVRPKLLRKILSKFKAFSQEHKEKLIIHSGVKDAYLDSYIASDENDFFDKIALTVIDDEITEEDIVGGDEDD